MLFASSGAIVCTGSGAFANNDDAVQRSGTYQIHEEVTTSNDRSDAQFEGQIMEEPAGAERRHMSSSSVHSFGTVHKASDLIGMEVRNRQNQKLGDIRDVMIDLRSGRVPFAILSSDVGNKLVALPPSALKAGVSENRLVLDMDRDRLLAAPSFERSRWPDMANKQWSSEVYRFYGVQPYWQTTSHTQPYYRKEVHTESYISEPAGARLYHADPIRTYDNRELGEVQGITRLDDISGNRSRGGAVDLQPFAHRNEGPIGTSSTWTHSAADQHATYQKKHHTMQRDVTETRMDKMGRYHRASDLIGMNIKNAQGETVGEVKDVVLDLNSGHVAYAVVSADRYLNTRGDELIAIPPTLFTTGADARMLTVNTERNVLMNAPRFQRENWTQVSNEKYVSRVYSHYGQRPYWQAQARSQSTFGPQFRDPSGTELNQYREHDDRYREEQFLPNDPMPQPAPQQFEQRNESSFQQEQQFNEPAGAEQKGQELQSEEPERSISEPSGAEPESQVAPESSSAVLETQESQASAPSAGFESQAIEGAQIEEKAGAEATLQSDLESPSPAPELESEISVHSESESTIAEPSGAEAKQQSSEEISEPSGAERDVDTHARQVQEAAGAAATPSTTPATAEQHQRLVEQVRTSLKNDSALEAQGIQVSMENGKIVLRGSVNDATKKQQIEERVRQIILDNQIQVQGTPPSSQP